MPSDVKVLIVGGGAAGLAAATELERLGVPCQVFEAQPRLGGRVHSVAENSEFPFERGAQMINGDMTAVLALAAEAKLHISPVPATGKDLCVVKGQVLPRDELVSSDEIEMLLRDSIRSWSSPSEVIRSLRSLYHWWSAPWEDLSEAARGLTRATGRAVSPRGSIGAVIAQLLLCAEDEAVAKSVIAEQFGADPDDLSALAARRTLEDYASERGDLEFHLPAGMSRIIEHLAKKLSRPPILDAPVTHIASTAGNVTLQAAGQQWRAARVIVAVPPPVARKICFDVSDARRFSALLSAFGSGAVIKTALSYDRPFWRQDGLSGAVTFAAPIGLEVRDTSHEILGRAQLTAFLGGPEARRRSKFSKEQRKDLLLGDLCQALGKAASGPVEVNEAIWVNGTWHCGGYNAFVKTGHPPDAARQLATWPGFVRFAGAELDDTFAGYVEGAIRSGRRVANDIAADLARGPL